MTAPNELLLDDILIRVESALDRRLAGSALIYPRDAVSLALRPEINQAAIAFFRRLDRRSADLIAAAPDDLRSINFASRCAGRDYLHFLGAIRVSDGINANLVLQNLPAQITAVRAVRKTLAWIEQQQDLVDLIEHETQPYE